jgi:hypothetical protein
VAEPFVPILTLDEILGLSLVRNEQVQARCAIVIGEAEKLTDRLRRLMTESDAVFAKCLTTFAPIRFKP